jgi:endonuclease IV
MGSSITPMTLGSPIMQVGFHLSGDAPLDAAAARGVDCVQFFLSDPQSWRTPPPRDDADALRAADMPLYVHAPYLVNVASPNNRIRVPSRRILQDTCEAAATVGAVAVIVHGGHVGDDTDFADGVDNWRKALERVETDVPIYIENTAGGDNAMARTLDAIERLWAGLDGLDVGFCFDTCHAHAAGRTSSTRSRGCRPRSAGSTWCTPTTRATRPAVAATGTRASAAARSLPTRWRPRSPRPTPR